MPEDKEDIVCRIENEEFKPDNNVITFMGADGVGKTVISQNLRDRLVKQYGQDKVVLVIGTDYNSWQITNDAKLKLQHFENQSTSDDFRGGKPRFYEFSAILCYRYVKDLVRKGKIVVLDSDPVFKSLMWDYLRESDLHQSMGRVQSKINRLVKGFFPGNIVFVHPQGNIDRASAEIWAILNSRKKKSAYDPNSLQEVKTRLVACTNLYNELKLMGSINGEINLIDINNQYVSIEDLQIQNDRCVDQIVRQLNA